MKECEAVCSQCLRGSVLSWYPSDQCVQWEKGS